MDRFKSNPTKSDKQKIVDSIYLQFVVQEREFSYIYEDHGTQCVFVDNEGNVCPLATQLSTPHYPYRGRIYDGPCEGDCATFYSQLADLDQKTIDIHRNIPDTQALPHTDAEMRETFASLLLQFVESQSLLDPRRKL